MSTWANDGPGSSGWSDPPDEPGTPYTNPDADRDIMVDGGFEKVLTDWVLTTAGDAAATLDTGTFYEGLRSLKLRSVMDEATCGTAQAQLAGIKLVPGETYQLIARVNADSAIDVPLPNLRYLRMRAAYLDEEEDIPPLVVIGANLSKLNFAAGWNLANWGTFVAPSATISLQFKTVCENPGPYIGAHHWFIDDVLLFGPDPDLVLSNYSNDAGGSDSYTPEGVGSSAYNNDSSPSTPWS